MSQGWNVSPSTCNFFVPFAWKDAKFAQADNAAAPSRVEKA
jgi:hypothetical protein